MNANKNTLIEHDRFLHAWTTKNVFFITWLQWEFFWSHFDVYECTSRFRFQLRVKLSGKCHKSSDMTYELPNHHSQYSCHVTFQSNQFEISHVMNVTEYNRVHIKGSHWLIEWFKTCKTSFFCFFLWRFPCIELLDYKYGQYGYLQFFLYHLVVIYIYISSYICIFLEYTHHLLMSFFCELSCQ